MDYEAGKSGLAVPKIRRSRWIDRTRRQNDQHPAPSRAKISPLTDTLCIMSKHSKMAPNPGGTVDETEAGFYEALQGADLDRLMACWADEDEIVCIHPGGGRLLGHGAIRAAFESIFNNGNLRIRPESIRKVDSMGCAVHSVRERIEVLTKEGPVQAFVLATNVYLKTAQGWRMVAHHASPGAAHEPHDISETPLVLH